MPSPHASLRLTLPGLALALPLLFACQVTPAGSNGAEAGTAGGPAEAGTSAAEVATITKIRGRAGVRADDLPDGAFLGEGAKLHAGQRIELPRGTRVELVLAGGARLRVDEDSALTLPSRADAEVPLALTLERGRMVVLAEDGGQVEVLAADDRLVVERGEAELHHAGETRHFGVVSGRAILHTAGREIPLGPGASISTPASPSTRPETPPDPAILAAALAPITSLAPLHDSAWTEAFDETRKIAEDLPEGVGTLVARRAGSSVERQSLRLTEQKVSVTISGRIARTEIEQAFHNDSSQTLEGIYQFPLPADASISDLQLLIGATWMRGEMLEKTRARQIFRQIVDATVPRDPALLQWEQGSVFKLNIFPIPGKGERRIKIAYTQVLPDVGDTLRYRYPMGGSGATAQEIGDFQFDVTIDDAGLGSPALAGVRTPMAELARAPGTDPNDLRLSLHERDYSPTHELGVDIPLTTGEGQAEPPRVLAATHRDRDGQGYFMLTLRPELAVAQLTKTHTSSRRPVHYAFVLDRSHGTAPELWAAAEGMTKALLSTLEPEDQFTLLACDTACDRLDGGLRKGSDDRTTTLAEVDRFLDGQVLAGASDIGNMLTRAADSIAGVPFSPALASSRPPATDVERVVVYLGDGAPTSGALTPDELGTLVREQLGDTRVQTVALGSRSDLLVLDHLARTSGGDLIQADARDNLDAIARELRLRASVPVLRDVQVELPPGLTDVYPKTLGAIRPGDTVTLVGKLADVDPMALRGDVRLVGRGEGRPIDERFQVMLDAEYSAAGATSVHAHLPRTWAQHEITHLTQTEGAAARDRIVALSREYNVLSRFTALLVLENDRMYREFRVARRAEDKNAWSGELAKTEAETKTGAASTSTPAVPSGGAPVQPFAPIEEISEEDGETEKNKESKPKSKDEATPADNRSGFDPAPPSPAPDADAGAEREESRFDDFSRDRGGGGEAAGGFDGDFDGFDGFDDFADEPKGSGGLIGGGDSNAQGKGSGSSAGPFAPAPKPSPTPSAPKKKNSASKSSGSKMPASQPSGNQFDWEDQAFPGGQGGGGWHDDGWGRGKRWQPTVAIRRTSGPSSDDLAAIRSLQAVRDADPSNRQAHRDLVRKAIREGHRDALGFTAAWATADPEHAPALLAHADQLAAAGDPLALRAYASAIEVEPFSTSMHRRMAQALASAGDFERSCSHRRALVSIDPRDADAAADLVECLVASGREPEARAALTRALAQVSSKAGRKTLTKVEDVFVRGVSPAKGFVHSNPELRAELRWSTSENLDVAFVDARGRRLSVLRPQGVLVREELDGFEHLETMTLREVSGTVFVEVTRPQSRSEEPLRATLTIKTPSGRERFELALEPGSKRVALVRKS